MSESGNPFPLPDAPVELRVLLSADERRLLLDGERDLSCGVCLVDRDGVAVLGETPPQAVLEAQPEAEPLWVQDGSRFYLCASLFHDGDRLALIATGPLASRDEDRDQQRAGYLCRLAETLLLSALRRTLAARVHVASVEEAYHELQLKNQRLEQALQRMQELDRIKANFLATVSHELRTPLTSVIGYSEMLMEGLAGPLNDEQREYLRTVMDKGEQLLHLITGILDISRIESSGVQLFLGAVELPELVHDVVATVTPQARRKHLRLAVDMQTGLAKVQGDRDKLRQVLLNLVGNAIKFTPDSGQVEICARAGGQGDGEDERGKVHLSVSDTGIGIPAHLYEKVFDPFFQVDNSSTREYEGTGLGLSIVRKFVEAHGGKVWIEGRQPQGVVFHLTLPGLPE